MGNAPSTEGALSWTSQTLPRQAPTEGGTIMPSALARAAFVVALFSPSALPAGQAIEYQLAPASGYVCGCQPPCLCPIKLYDDLTGSLELGFVGSLPNWFDVYRVQDVDWLLVDQKKPVHITGSGLYEIGGQVALMHRLQLDLSFDGGPVRHFDSGLVQGGGTFPEIAIDIALNGFYCLDEVFTVAAFPLDVGIPYCTSTKNSTGERAHVRAFGSTVVSDDDLTLVATDLPPGKAAVFFFGATKAHALRRWIVVHRSAARAHLTRGGRRAHGHGGAQPRADAASARRQGRARLDVELPAPVPRPGRRPGRLQPDRRPLDRLPVASIRSPSAACGEAGP
jgi:hypothetical protein